MGSLPFCSSSRPGDNICPFFAETIPGELDICSTSQKMESFCVFIKVVNDLFGEWYLVLHIADLM